jgi:DNA polymerase I-like protein with 3'-5' exonuclease and polymerase domains
MEVVLDIETDSLDAKEIYCIVAKERVSGKVHVWKEHQCYETFPVFAKRVSKFIMHNGISFDADVLNRLTSCNITIDRIEDTMILSQLTNPVRDGGHSLEAWGGRLGFNKIDFHDFSCLSQEMIDYCIRDVELTERLYITLQPELKQISRECIDLEYRVRHLVSAQERNGFALDMQKAMCLVARLKDKSDAIENEVTKMFPPLPTHTKDVKIKIKKDGTLSSVGL